MSQTAYWAVNLGATTRKRVSTGATAGAGSSLRLCVGRDTAYDYKSYLRFALDWSGKGKIVSAYLNLYTDDGQAVTPVPGFPLNTTTTPKITVRRNTGLFDDKTHNSEWIAGDWTAPAQTSSGGVTKTMERAVNALSRIDVTAMVKAWAPVFLGGSNQTNYGFVLQGSTLAGEKWSGWSESAAAEYRPILELVYEYGATVPYTPTNLSPVGAVTSLGGFQADFSDPRGSDQLGFSEVEVYTVEPMGTAATNDVITATAHELVNGAIVNFLSLTGGAGLSTFRAYWVRDRTANTFKVSAVKGGAAVNITTVATALYWAIGLYAKKLAASGTERLNARSDHVPSWHPAPAPNTNYKWRIRLWDQESQVSPWSALVTYSVINTDPNPPTLTPANGTSVTTLDGVLFRSGTFTDPDAGDTMLAYQVQACAYPEGDGHWDDGVSLVWDTGKVYGAVGMASFSADYGGMSLDAGTYYWRARVWDNRDGVSSWVYRSIVLTADFVQEPGQQDDIQLRPNAPWRIVIKAMGTLRGPGETVAIFENAKSVGASLMYNSPGELHFTLPIDDPQISVVEPKRTHYSVQFYSGDGWREVFAGLIMDYDATEKDVVFYGQDYLALYGYVYDERYDPAIPDKSSEDGGSKYITIGKNSISYIVKDQLSKAKALANSPVGFITVNAGEALTLTPTPTMPETMQVYSTFQPTLSFVASLLDSHKQGGGKKTRLVVRQKTGGGYEVAVLDDPGRERPDLRLRYGELVQGFRVIPFGVNWGSRMNVVGRDRNGLMVRYKSDTGAGIDESVWGRFAQLQMLEDVSDENDLARRTKQLATKASKLGSQIGLGLRSGIIQPCDGYTLCDHFPVAVQRGPIDTSHFGSGFWTCLGVSWEAADQGQQVTTLTLLPREDSVAPNPDLLVLKPISPQDEWQVGWEPPDPLKEHLVYLALDTGLFLDDDLVMDTLIVDRHRYHLDVTTGIVYTWNGTGWVLAMAPPTPPRPTGMLVTSRITTNPAGVSVVNIGVQVS